jgi:hypothetical protein
LTPHNRTLAIAGTARTLELIRVASNPDFTLAHKNKYGEDYVPPPAIGYTK